MGDLFSGWVKRTLSVWFKSAGGSAVLSLEMGLIGFEGVPGDLQGLGEGSGLLFSEEFLFSRLGSQACGGSHGI
jgi:hypothetical protein